MRGFGLYLVKTVALLNKSSDGGFPLGLAKTSGGMIAVRMMHYFRMSQSPTVGYIHTASVEWALIFVNRCIHYSVRWFVEHRFYADSHAAACISRSAAPAE